MGPARTCALVAAAGAALSLSIASAHAQPRTEPSPPGSYFLTIVARHCPAYTDIRPNLARNNIQESLQDLGPGVSPYETGEQMSPLVEDPTHPKCAPLVGWKFQMGTDLAPPQDAKLGPWGKLSIIRNAIAPWSIPATAGGPRELLPVITTQESVPDRGPLGGVVAGSSLPGAVTVELTTDQATRAGNGEGLSLQGGTVSDPALAQDPLGAGYAFGALRCGSDNYNGDNVEWLRFGGIRHIYCYAYYVTPPPKSATIIVRKRVSYPQKATADFDFQGNVSYTVAQNFQLNVRPDLEAQPPYNTEPTMTFYRSETRSGDPPWTFTETGSGGYLLTGIDCTNKLGSTITTNRATATVRIDNLLAADVVDCTFTNEQRPQGGTLQISKESTGAVGTFPFTVERIGGTTTRTTTATTTVRGVEVDALPGPLALDPGDYQITETLPAQPSGGEWRDPLVVCNSRPLTGARRTATKVVTVTAATGVACKFTNSFIPDGAITVAKTSIGGSGTSGFLIAYRGDPAREYVQSAQVGEDETVTATGDSTARLPLGQYVIQETATLTDAGRPWLLTGVVCDGQPTPFQQKQVIVELTVEHPKVACRFENRQIGTFPLPDPRPTPSPMPPSPLPAPGPAPPVPPVDLVVTKRALSPNVRVGELATFMVTVRNASDVPAIEVGLADRPRSPGQAVTARASKGSCTERPTTTCHLGTLAPGESATVRMRVRATASGTLRNVTAAGSSTPELRLSNNLARAQARVLPAPGGPCANAAQAGGPVAHAAC